VTNIIDYFKNHITYFADFLHNVQQSVTVSCYG